MYFRTFFSFYLVLLFNYSYYFFSFLFDCLYTIFLLYFMLYFAHSVSATLLWKKLMIAISTWAEMVSYGPSWYSNGPSCRWAEMPMGRVCLRPQQMTLIGPPQPCKEQANQFSLPATDLRGSGAEWTGGLAGHIPEELWGRMDRRTCRPLT